MVLIENWRQKDELERSLVSVPLRGLWFLSSFFACASSSSVKRMFPSPCGDYGSYPVAQRKIQQGAFQVSVPLRGLWFLSDSIRKRPSGWAGRFRPLAGIMVLILQTFFCITTKRRCFRPLAGIMVLIRLPLIDLCRDSSQCVSVPLRGLWFLSLPSHWWDKSIKQESFRPLAGIMVLISL